MPEGDVIHEPSRRLKLAAEFADLVLVGEEVWG